LLKRAGASISDASSNRLYWATLIVKKIGGHEHPEPSHYSACGREIGFLEPPRQGAFSDAKSGCEFRGLAAAGHDFCRRRQECANSTRKALWECADEQPLHCQARNQAEPPSYGDRCSIAAEIDYVAYATP
jgi:hypothetical protein